jgi:V/A-type H+-transporting ATPase subunit I
VIARMKRAFLVLFEKDKTASLAELRAMGLLHLEPVAGSGESFDRLAADKACFEKALATLSFIRVEQSGEAFSLDEGRAFAGRINALSDEIKSSRERAADLSAEIDRLRPWGDFDPELIRALAAGKLVLTLAEVPAKRLAALDPSIEYLRLSEAKGVVRIAVIGAAPVSADLRRFEPPSSRLSVLETELERIRAAGTAATADIVRAASRTSALQRAAAVADRDLAFEAIRSGLPGEGAVSWFAAWVPEKDAERLTVRAGERGWGLLLDDPAEDELPPTKIENPAIIRLVQPVFDFLGTTPHYREYDISGWFLFFFCFFFAMIFGDGGYGSLLLLAGLAAAGKTKAAGKAVPDPVRLLLLLAGSTILWGIFTASWFGLDPARLPGILRTIAIPWFSNANPLSGENVKVLCFSIGLVQLVVAHLKNIKRDLGSLKFLAQFGQLAMLAGMYVLALNLVINAGRFPIPGWAPLLIAAGFTVNFIFANYPSGQRFFKALGRSVLGSFGNIVSVFLGVVNIFADIVSYIRLWAVGLAGLAISQTINSMAGPLLGHLAFFLLGMILIVFGHGLNLIMSVLGVVVHGVRLNMLEFSGHLGMEWSGYKYAPFRDTTTPKGEKP